MLKTWNCSIHTSFPGGPHRALLLRPQASGACKVSSIIQQTHGTKQKAKFRNWWSLLWISVNYTDWLCFTMGTISTCNISELFQKCHLYPSVLHVLMYWTGFLLPPSLNWGRVCMAGLSVLPAPGSKISCCAIGPSLFLSPSVADG